ncbi:receptor-like protein kinase FERONIA isoform X1 [Arachis stenosperma]|uniref:receptor-like protein kinase FERONIA isoform X1 n=1 Tax=Arachis stenosperma TaxID=217475 RepID=UPI0025AC78FB|nr:receptor-like protein kinase FERONIA isoform X1 [Arachis stenosperma]
MWKLRNKEVACSDAPLVIINNMMILSLIFVLQLMFVNSYVPTDDVAVSCGSSQDETKFNGRIWVGDDVNTIIPHNMQPSVTAEAPNSVSVDAVPFVSARFFRSKFTYSFRLKTNGPKFVRLHFYPTTYNDNFEAYNSLFSVTAAGFTLLKDFNASLWLLSDTKTVSIEFCINVESGERLNITFIPSTNHHNAYAFINGIEVVSMPPFLYYTDLSNDTGFEQVGSEGTLPYQLGSGNALETLYRINVAGIQVPPSSDTGMFRDWETDYPGYLEKRLHYCSWDENIQTYGDLVFQIFIADIMAEQGFSVIRLTGGRLVPGHKDYAVFIPGKNGISEKLILSIKLQRMRQGHGTSISDVLLNGIEIFKISDGSNNLAGPNPDPVLFLSPKSPPFPQSSKTSKEKISIVVIIAVVAAVIICLMLASIIGVIIFRRRRRSFGKKGSTKKEGSSSLPSHLCRYFTIAEIRAATNNFDDVFIVGVGGFGNVYKGYVDDGATPVAIKRLKPGSQQGITEFLNEIDMLSQLRHLHLVSLIGYCNDGVEMILVYDFMQRGTLREYLYGSDNNPLPWKQRLEILLGAARGLHYLHAGAKHNIIHRDVKSTNILLDEKWVAKVSDFGLSKVGPTGTSQTHVSTMVKGSLGYLDPEYYKRQRLTLKSDVYSFGVVLLEVLCARPPLIRNVDKHKASLVDWVRKLNDQGKLDHTVDIFLKGSITPECLKWYGQLAMSCLHDDGNQRPSMNDVVGALEFAMQLAEGDKDNSFGGAQDKEKGAESPLIPQLTSDEGSDVLFTSDESGTKDSRVTTISGSSEERAMISGLVFSEIGDPRAR